MSNAIPSTTADFGSLLKQACVAGSNNSDSDTPKVLLEKSASILGDIVRRRMREDSFAEAIIEFMNIGATDLTTPMESGDVLPYVVLEVEPAQFGPKTCSFDDAPDVREYSIDRAVMTFHSNITPEWTKNKFRVMNVKADIAKITEDNSLRDLGNMRDYELITLVDDLAGPTPDTASPETGLIQYNKYSGTLTRDNIVNLVRPLQRRLIPIGTLVCNRITWNEIARWTRNEMGGDFAQDLILKGEGAWQTAEIFGYKFIVTQKFDLVNDGVIYQFATPQFLGKAGVLQPPTAYIKHEYDIVKFRMEEKIGMVIANRAAVQKTALTIL